MTIDQATDLVRQCLMTGFILVAPVLVAAMVIGLLISVIQAVTQIHEQTLTLVPKIAAMVGVTVLAAPWMMRMFLEFAQRMFTFMD